MLSFFQSSRDQAQPVHLFEVVYGIGVGSYIYMTDAEKPIVYVGNTYSVAQIKSGEISASGILDKATIELRTPYTNPLTEVFRTGPPDAVVDLSILRGDLNDPDGEYLRLWSGRILGFGIEGNESKFTCEPIGTATRRPGLRRNFQFGCPHVLYGPHCRADRLSATVGGTVQSVSGMIVKLGGGWFGALDPAKFQGGIATWPDPSGNIVNRTILQVANGAGVGTDLLLSGLPTGLVTGSGVLLSLGCNHQRSDCQLIHGNINNFGGQPWIPMKNPISSINNFY